MSMESIQSGILKWNYRHVSKKTLVLILSLIVGIASGLAAVILKTTTHYIQDWLTEGFEVSYLNYLYFAYPLFGILLTVLFIVYLNKDKLGHGLSHILYTISRRSSLVERDKTYSHMATSALTVGFGGSVGLEAPIVITGSAIGSNIGSFFHLNYQTRTLLIGCGAAGAIAAIFNAPIAGVIFTLEVLLLQLAVPSFIPLLLSAIAGNVVTKLLLGEEILLHFEVDADAFQLWQIPFFVGLGIITGLVATYFARITYWLESWFAKFKSRWTKWLIGGSLLGVLILLFPPLYGEGFDTIKNLFNNNPEALLENSPMYGFLSDHWLMLAFITLVMFMKVFAMNFTLGGGGNGGYFAPSLFIGAIAGFAFARGINMLDITEPLPEPIFALVGMAGAMSGILHAPLTGIFIIAEITSGYELVVPLMIVSVISYATMIYFEPHSMYTKQLERKGDLIIRNKDRAVLTNMSLKRVIEKDLITVQPEQSLGDLVEVVAQSKRNIFPVVDDEGMFQGVIMLDDIRTIMFKPDKYGEVLVRNLMHSPPALVESSQDMDQVMQKFQETGAWNLPVVDEGKYIGFLSKSKIFSIYRTMLIKQTKTGLS
jgi:CIC family chloride channel protein